MGKKHLSVILIPHTKQCKGSQGLLLTDFSHANEVSGAGIDLLEILHRGEQVTVTVCGDYYPDIDPGAAGSVDQSTRTEGFVVAVAREDEDAFHAIECHRLNL